MAPKAIVPGSTPGISHEYATLNGRRYHYLLGVPRGGKFRNTIFLIHGWPDCSYGWRYQFEALMKLGLRVVAPDCIGYGQTDAPTVPPNSLNLYTFKQAADDIKALATQMGLSKIILGGHDWGAVVVYRTYQYYPDLITHLFTLCVPHFAPTKQFISLELFAHALPNFRYQLQLASGEVEKRLTSKDDMRLFINCMFGGRGPKGEPGFSVDHGIHFENLKGLNRTPLLSDEELEYYTQEYSNHGLHGPCNWYKTREENFNYDKELQNPNIEVPTLFIAAKDDPTILSDMYSEDHRLIPDFTLREVNTSHWAMAQDPVNVNKYITEWIQERVFSGKPKA